MSFTCNPLTDIFERVMAPHTNQRLRYPHERARTQGQKALSTKRVRFHEVDDFLASQSESLKITFSVLSHEVIVRRLWLRAAQPTTYLSNALLHAQSGQFFNNQVPRFPCQMTANCLIGSSKISGDSIARCNDLGFLVPLQFSGLVYAFEKRTEPNNNLNSLSIPESGLETPNPA